MDQTTLLIQTTTKIRNCDNFLLKSISFLFKRQIEEHNKLEPATICSSERPLRLSK